jgi:hypothetical protein
MRLLNLDAWHAGAELHIDTRGVIGEAQLSVEATTPGMVMPRAFLGSFGIIADAITQGAPALPAKVAPPARRRRLGSRRWCRGSHDDRASLDFLVCGGLESFDACGNSLDSSRDLELQVFPGLLEFATMDALEFDSVGDPALGAFRRDSHRDVAARDACDRRAQYDRHHDQGRAHPSTVTRPFLFTYCCALAPQRVFRCDGSATV